jgi:hypothetical protein
VLFPGVPDGDDPIPLPAGLTPAILHILRPAPVAVLEQLIALDRPAPVQVTGAVFVPIQVADVIPTAPHPEQARLPVAHFLALDVGEQLGQGVKPLSYLPIQGRSVGVCAPALSRNGRAQVVV